MRIRHTSPNASPGSALAIVLILSAVIAIIIASVISGTVTEMKVNDRYVARIKAKAAAESAIEYGASELAYRFENQTSLGTNDLKQGNDPLSLPATIEEFLRSGDIDYEKMAIYGGIIPPGEWMYFDPNDPANEFDPMRGRRVFVREIELYGKGTANTYRGDGITAYATERFQVRDAPLFANAIFYNSDLEINPGVDMDVYGPVHTNGTLYVGAKSTATLSFHNKVTAHEGFIHGEINPVHIGDGSNVQFPSRLNPENLRGMRTGGNILDSNDSSWVEDASERWNGFVQNGDMGVGKQNVIAFDDYEADNPYTYANETENSGYALIEPLLPHGHPDRKANDMRLQKMAYKAGLLLRVESTPGKSPSDDDYLRVKGYKYQRANPDDPLSDPVLDSDGDPVLVAVTLPADLIGNPDNNFQDVEDTTIEKYDLSTQTTTTYYYDRRGRLRSNTTTETGVHGGLYDHREDYGINTFALDVGSLKDHVDANDNSSSGFDGTYDVTKDWNGIVYVEFPTDTSTNGDGSFKYGASSGQNSYGIVPGTDETLALMVMDAREIPDPAGMKDPGFTLATNAPMYTVGSFNANGSAHSYDAIKVDDANEKPAALMADTLTVLSDNWKNNRINSHLDGRSNVQSYREANSYVEISAAIVSGTPNTVPNGAPYGDGSRPLSLGVVNLPRFLESWTSRTLTIRGSLVSLYESELRPRGAPSNFNDFYLPPIRDWGFNELFASGSYPPGTPLIRTYRRLMYEEIDKDSYESAIASLD